MNENYALKNLISPLDLSSDMLERLIAIATSGKKSAWSNHQDALKGKSIGLLFFNSSLRTRASFQSGIGRLGGSCSVINVSSDSWNLETEDGIIMNGSTAEHIKEAAGVLSTYFDALGVRCFPEMSSWEEDKKDLMMSSFLEHLSIPLINMESALWHPCQALADAMTVKETFGSDLSKKKFVLSWANHPKQLPMAVPNSTLIMAAQLGMNLELACPKGYELDSEVLEQAQSFCSEAGSSFSVSHDQASAFSGAHVVYAKSWTPPTFVGKAEEEIAERSHLSDWVVTPELMSYTDEASFMHCLPVRRNVVVADEVLDSPQSIVIRQAENRLHAQNALLLSLLGAN